MSDPVPDVVVEALRAHEGNVSRAARALGVSRGWLLRRIPGSSRGAGRPRNETADALVRKLGRSGLRDIDVVDVVRATGRPVSRGTIRRRLIALRERGILESMQENDHGRRG